MPVLTFWNIFLPCYWSLHMWLVLPVLNHKIQSYILGKKISNLHGSLSWEPTLDIIGLKNQADISGQYIGLEPVLSA